MPDSAPIAGARSFRGRRWRVPQVAPEAVRALAAAGLQPALAPIMAARGLPAEAVGDYLRPSLRGLLPNPAFFLDMDAAADRIVRAVLDNQSIAIWGDYDVDGATSSAILARFLRQAGSEARIYIPDRISEGYGPNEGGLSALKQEGCDLVCVLDAGTVHFEQAAHAGRIGLDMVIVDHHAAEDELPAAAAVVNPNRKDQAPGYGHLCAAGVTFMLCVALNARLRDQGWYEAIGVKPDLMGLLDLAALGTVADVVPLTGLNRAFVARGLEVMARRGNPGLTALLEAAHLKGAVDAYHCGFVLGPRVNAGGRIGEASTGARLLASDDPDECRALAEKLDGLNKERQQIERACVAEAVARIEADPGLAGREALVIVGEDWHEGVIGIVASRLKDLYDKPTFVFSRAEGGLLKGSARSMAGFDLGACVIEARRQGLLVKGGGHAMAAGASLREADLPAFSDLLCARVAESPFAATGPVQDLDAEIPLDRVSVGLAEAMEAMQPFGVGNPRPRFLIARARIKKVDVLKDAHLKLELIGETGRSVKAIAFNAVGTPLGDGLFARVEREVEIAGTLQINEWRGWRSAEILIDDARAAPGEAP